VVSYNYNHMPILYDGFGDIKSQTLDTCKRQSIIGRTFAHTTSDRTAQKLFLLYGRGKLCSKFGEDRSISDVTILSTDARQTDGRSFT